MEFLVGRTNLACTIFVPFDCNNNCPFCTSKDMYRNGIKLDADAIVEVIKRLNSNYDIREYVLTGGEPFANLSVTKRLINEMDKKCYINTTLPMVDNIEEVIDYINNEKKIRGINISRHIGFNFSGVANLALIDKIQKPVRINTVINKNFSFEKFKEFVKEWGSDLRLINLRADYTKLDATTLKSRDWVEEKLAEEYTYGGAGGCLVCQSSLFEADNCNIQYHRGLMFSSVNIGNKTYINDVIVTPDGSVYKDWDMKNDDEFNHWIFKDPDIESTEIVMDIDWLDNGTIEQFYYQNTNTDKISITKDRNKSTKISNKSQLDETIKCLKKQLRNSIKQIYTV